MANAAGQFVDVKDSCCTTFSGILAYLLPWQHTVWKDIKKCRNDSNEQAIANHTEPHAVIRDVSVRVCCCHLPVTALNVFFLCTCVLWEAHSSNWITELVFSMWQFKMKFIFTVAWVYSNEHHASASCKLVPFYLFEYIYILLI